MSVQRSSEQNTQLRGHADIQAKFNKQFTVLTNYFSNKQNIQYTQIKTKPKVL